MVFSQCIFAKDDYMNGTQYLSLLLFDALLLFILKSDFSSRM